MDKINDRVHLSVSDAHLLLTYTGPLHMLLLQMGTALPASFTWLYLFLSFGFQWGTSTASSGKCSLILSNPLHGNQLLFHSIHHSCCFSLFT